MANTNDMTVGSPTKDILRFSIPLILGYILQQMYQIIDAVIVGRWIGVGALAAVGASSSIMFLIMGFCNGACAGFAIPAVCCDTVYYSVQPFGRIYSCIRRFEATILLSYLFRTRQYFTGYCIYLDDGNGR